MITMKIAAVAAVVLLAVFCALHQHVDSLSHVLFLPPGENVALNIEQQPAPVLGRGAVDLGSHAGSAGAFFFREQEHAEPIELEVGDEIQEAVEGRCAFTGVAHNDRCAQCDLFVAMPDALQQLAPV